MRFLPLSFPTILGYVASALLAGAPESGPMDARPSSVARQQMVYTSPDVQPDLMSALQWLLPTAPVKCAAGEGVVVAAAPMLGAVQYGLLTQFMLFGLQIVSGTVAAMRPRFTEISDNELLASALHGLATR